MYTLLKNKFDRLGELEQFLIKAGTLFVAYYLFRMVMNTVFNDLIYNSFKDLLFSIHLTGAGLLLDITGYDWEYFCKKGMRIIGSPGVKVMKACLGTKIMAIFGAFIIIYKGRVINKLWFIPTGVIYIIFINIFRIYFLVLVSFYSFEYVEFVHDYILKPIVYIFVFLLWILWIKKYSRSSS